MKDEIKREKVKQAKLTADSRKEAIVKVRESGIAVTSIEELTGILYKEINIGQNKS